MDFIGLAMKEADLPADGKPVTSIKPIGIVRCRRTSSKFSLDLRVNALGVVAGEVSDHIPLPHFFAFALKHN